MGSDSKGGCKVGFEMDVRVCESVHADLSKVSRRGDQSGCGDWKAYLLRMLSGGVGGEASRSSWQPPQTGAEPPTSLHSLAACAHCHCPNNVGK